MQGPLKVYRYAEILLSYLQNQGMGTIPIIQAPSKISRALPGGSERHSPRRACMSLHQTAIAFKSVFSGHPQLWTAQNGSAHLSSSFQGQPLLSQWKARAPHGGPGRRACLKAWTAVTTKRCSPYGTVHPCTTLGGEWECGTGWGCRVVRWAWQL
jgi:hypothetical protein